MIKRSENHEKYCKGWKPHFYLSECQAGLVISFTSIGIKRTRLANKLFDARDRIDNAWAMALSKRINP